jgi:hypothetical protein
MSSELNDNQRGKRSLKRYLGGRRLSLNAHLVQPFKQIRFGLYVIGVCLAFLVVLVAVLVWAFRQQYEQVMEWFNVAAAESTDLMMNDVSGKVGVIVGLVLVLFVITMLMVVVRRTHRMYGPMISIARFLGELKRGNYSARLKIRKGDDFQDMVDSLNDLAATLHQRHGVLSSSQILPVGDDEEDEQDVVSVNAPADKP